MGGSVAGASGFPAAAMRRWDSLLPGSPQPTRATQHSSPLRRTDVPGLGPDLLLLVNGNNLWHFGQGGPPGACLM